MDMYPELIIMDNFLNPEEIVKINQDETFWIYGYRWHGITDEIKDLRHRLIQVIYRDGCFNQLIGLQVAGFEHWVGINNENSELSEIIGPSGEEFALGPHRDKDEDYWEAHPKGKYGGNHIESMLTPILGSILYTTTPEEGGYLKIWDKSGDWSNPETPYELIKPKENRLILFDAGAQHAVMPVKKGERRAIAINLWAKQPSTFRHGFYNPPSPPTGVLRKWLE